MKLDLEVEVIDLQEFKLPVYDTEKLPQEQEQIKLSLEKKLNRSDGFVIVTPEWNGMVPAALKNFFLYFNFSVFAHKPTLIVSVSSGHGGAFPIAELRMSSYKNSRILYIPEQIIVRNVNEVLNLPPENTKNLSKDDAYLRERLDYALKILNLYIQALKPIRKSAVLDFEKFRNGMS